MELERNGLRAPGELQKNTVTQQATQQNPEKPKPTCLNYKKPGHYRMRETTIRKQHEKCRQQQQQYRWSDKFQLPQ